jgi:hypothetical protein
MRKAEGLFNLATKGGVDSVLKMALKTSYSQYRERVAIKRAERALAKGQPA